MDIEAVLGVVGTMRYIFLILIALMVSFSAASYVCADTNADRSVGKITTDPNVGGKPAEEPEVEIDLLERDSRLDKKITYEARKKRVVEIIEDLEALSGVTLRAGYNKKDWQVRDRKMNIFAKDTPLRDALYIARDEVQVGGFG